MASRIKMSLAVLALAVAAGCQTSDSGGGSTGSGRTPFIVFDDQPIPDDGPLIIQFFAGGGVRLQVTVTGNRDTAPDFQLAIGQYQSEDFGNIPEGDIAIDSAPDRRAGFAEGTFDTVIEGTYTLFVTDQNSVADAVFSVEVS